MKRQQSGPIYQPNLGFIGHSQVEVSNYLFRKSKKPEAYSFSQKITEKLSHEPVKSHFKNSQSLTKFLEKRDLTFSKKTKNGDKVFAVPCTTTIVPMQKSLFNIIEKSAQRLVVALRLVLQDIYGSKDLESSRFIRSLKKHDRDIFIKALKTSPGYFKALHHPNMKDYPFFDNIGLDLVLVKDYLMNSQKYLEQIKNNEKVELPELPFKILEINAGSPSGASNNMNILEGLAQQDPELMKSLGNIMPNDHFEVLGETFKSLGETWTGIKDAVQVILPPGGQNGAAPEIHQLAAYSHLVYADADQLYRDDEGYIRLRTTQKHNPIVNAIYSRVNADSALFDPSKDILLKNPDTNENIYLRDFMRLDKNGKATLVKDSNGNPIPLESIFSIPQALEAIQEKKLYLGGLNRALDNKIILTILTQFAPQFYQKELKELGLDDEVLELVPPRTLEPEAKSVEIIKKNPENWVVKAPNLAGGQGVYILKTLSLKEQQEVLKTIQKKPTEYAYQELVKIARIPVAVQSSKTHRLANLAADMRMWVFYPGKGLPRLTHNALVRYAPHEKGKMSSIVNTSAGGGYAPFIVLDDTNSPKAKNALDACRPVELKPLQCDLPVFVGAQIQHTFKLLRQLKTELLSPKMDANLPFLLTQTIKTQLKEIISFLHPQAMTSITSIEKRLMPKVHFKDNAKYALEKGAILKDLISHMKSLEKISALDEVFKICDNLYALSDQPLHYPLTEQQKKCDLESFKSIKEIIAKANFKNFSDQRQASLFISRLQKLVKLQNPSHPISSKNIKLCLMNIENFVEISKTRISISKYSRAFLEEMNTNIEKKEDIEKNYFSTLYLNDTHHSRSEMIASGIEIKEGKSIEELGLIDNELIEAKKHFQNLLNDSSLTPQERVEKQFEKFPRLREIQEIINKGKTQSLDDLIKVLPVTPYAYYNLKQFARTQGISIENLKDVFSNNYKPGKICLLSEDELKKEHVNYFNKAGECMAQKRRAHGLFSNSDIFIWMRNDAHIFETCFTIGHELIHLQQIDEHMKEEVKTLDICENKFSKFLAYYSSFLAQNMRTLEKSSVSTQSLRKPIIGLMDRYFDHFNSKIIRELRSAIKKGDHAWNMVVEKYGSLWGRFTPSSNPMKVKALQEILPAIENAKNIYFAKSLGLTIPFSEVRSALPTANPDQIRIYEQTIFNLVYEPRPSYQNMRVVANHQIHGVYFSKQHEDLKLKLIPEIATMNVSQTYNQTQQ